MTASDAAKSVPGITFADDDPMNAPLTIIFDDTNMEKIREAMKKSGFPLEGEPEYLMQ